MRVVYTSKHEGRVWLSLSLKELLDLLEHYQGSDNEIKDKLKLVKEMIE